MTGNEKVTSFNLAGRPEAALSTHEYHTFILQIKQAGESSSMSWRTGCDYCDKTFWRWS